MDVETLISQTFQFNEGTDDYLKESAEMDVETLISWTFQFNEGTNDYSLFFGFLDKNGKYLSVDGTVDIRIVNEMDEEVYMSSKNFSKDDFGYYSNEISGEQFLANVRIPASEITDGKSSSGKVYLTVYHENIYAFDEVNCYARYNLPISDIQLIHEAFPQEIKVTDYRGETDAILQITDITYEFEKEYTPKLKITVFGEKTYDKSGSYSAYDIIEYKLCDSEGYIINSGSVFLDSLREGDKFKDDSIIIYDLIPGETYELRLMERAW
ncbi:MAG: hypothetical protein J6I50_08470 [Clostridia bacterium]|nr:hypothetical protein [Clostridia bacterium]